MGLAKGRARRQQTIWEPLKTYVTKLQNFYLKMNLKLKFGGQHESIVQ